ncbi:50S ribosomal protein L4 [Chamaesiphon polymorphus]|uniref:Large ribosomal subunit protein uL4 n=1 Tax=Chamaesiphon polymorphus CCALA 037 TaxID=2107692 RepID=A0A2T1F5F7_9CYAN|nr:50S ribosomal protein L4 [Chamaesiphon polymorphus]PSB40158.1 50S ribosomal protein L4 [Chamaesiphon polymorphus CCALA 037]
MANCVIRNWQGEEAGSATLELAVAKAENASHIVHRALIRQTNNARQGTASAKTRAEVRGGGRKPWKQKGTGRARAGSIRSPLWRGGGVIFGPKPKDYNMKMNRKERRLALRTALMGRIEDIIVVQDFTTNLAQPKTKEFVQAMTRWGVEPDGKVLVIVAEVEDNTLLSVRNIANVKMISASGLNVFDLLNADQIVATAEAIAKIQEVYNDD